MKPPDKFTVPMCNGHHAEQHLVGHRAFDERHHINLRVVAESYAARSPVLRSEDTACLASPSGQRLNRR